MANLISSVLKDNLPSIVYIHPDLSVKQCANLMCQHNIGALVVTDDDNILGIVSERDIVRKCVSQNGDINQMTAGDITYANVSCFKLNDPLELAIEAMTSTRRRHVLIMDGGKLPVAILSIGDVLSFQLGACSLTVEQLKDYIHG